MKQRIPRLARLVDGYLRLFGPAGQHIEFMERSRLKGAYVQRMRREVDRIKSRRAGFTLVEMLVSVALVVLMMSLFAVIFQFATQSMAVQKGTAENDQKVRLVMTLLRGDIENRTQQFVLPFRPVATDANLSNGLRLPERRGYLYIGENDPDDDTDDVLQLTVESTDLFYGAARVDLSFLQS